MMTIKKWLVEFWQYRPLLGQLITKDIKLKYRRSILGYFWSILDPLMLMGIMVLVFSNMFRFEIENYPVYLIIGQTVYNFVSESTSQSTWAIIGNAALMKKTYVPKYIFTVSRVTSGLVNMVFAMGAMVIVFIICRVNFTLKMLFIPVILVQVYIFALGLGLLLACATAFFRDVQHIYSAFLTAWMYATPIFYPAEQLPGKIMWIIRHFNPLYSYITQFRVIVLESSFPEPSLVFLGIAMAFFMLFVGGWIFFRAQDKFILYI